MGVLSILQRHFKHAQGIQEMKSANAREALDNELQILE
jgi:hypothetical protein